MIKFTIFGIPGTFENAQVSLEGKSLLIHHYESSLQVEIENEYRDSPHKMAGIEAATLTMLERKGATILQTTREPSALPGLPN